MSKALQILQASDGLLSALIENLPGGAVFVVDRDLRYLLAQGEALVAAGFQPEDFVGRTIFEALPPELSTQYERFYRQALAGESFEVEHNSHDRWYMTRGTPLRTAPNAEAGLAPDGEVYAVLAVSYDISERKRTEAIIAADLRDTQLLQDLSTRLVAQTDIQVFYDEILTAAIALTQADAGSLQVLDEATQELVLIAIQGSTPMMAEHLHRVNASSNTPCGIALAIGQRTFTDFDVPECEDSDASSRLHIQAGFLSAQSTPLTTRAGKPIGMVSTHWRKYHRPSDRELRFLDLLARQAADLIEQRRAEQSLRESEQKHRSLFTTMDQGFCIIEKVETLEGQPSDFRYLTVNPAFERHTGMHDVVGKTIRECVPDAEHHIMDIYDDVVRTEQPQHFEDYVSALDLWIEAEVFPAQVPGQIAVLFSDVSDRNQAERVLHESEERQAFLLELSDTLRAQPNAEAIASTAMMLLAEYLHLDRAYIATMYAAKELSIVGPEYRRPDLKPISGVYRLSDFPETFRQMKEGTFWFNNIADDPNLSDMDRQSMMAASDFSALIIGSLRKGEKNLTWALVAASTQPRQWTPSEIALVEETAERTWAAMERARAEAALREAELQQMREQAAREQERQRVEALAELDRAKTLFFSNISHEFRTPLTLLLAPLQDALSDPTLAPIHRERLELARRNSLRLLKLVNTLLDFSRIEAGRMEANYEPTDLAQLTTDLASVFRSAIEHAGLRLIVDCPPLPEPVYVDREMWEKIVLNLFSNALKFTFEGEITVSLHPNDHNQVMLQVRDTGSGIAAEHLPHLFERFYQVRGVQARTHEGSGIGLALVNELVQLQGGAIAVSSTVGEGTCFTITLPLGTDHLPPEHIQSTRTLTSTALSTDAYVQEAEQWLPIESAEAKVLRTELEESIEELKPNNQTSANSQSSFPQSQFSVLSPQSSAPAHVLIVDDNADMRQYLTHILSESVQVEAVADGASALAAIQTQPPDLVLSDVMMPRLDGFGLLQTLRTNPRTREIPVILLSARAGEEAIAEGLDTGADDYLIKPFSAQELIARVKAHLQISLLRGEALHTARTALRRKDELLSVVSHELNTPLVSILGWTRLLRANPPNPTMLGTALDTIERSAMMQAKLVQDLLDVSRITAGKLRLHLQPTELKAVIAGAIATVTQLAAEAEIHLAWTETTTAVVMGDRERLQQVICNLLTNAIKFTPTGGRIEVHLSVVSDQWSLVEGQMTNDQEQMTNDHYAEICVIDTGIGIAADFLPHVFEQFRQAEGTHSVKGLGLGLAIAHHIVELHSGTIQAQSAGEGQGATFIIKLPLLESNS